MLKTAFMKGLQDRSGQIQAPVVSAQQMRDIESQLFASGMPVAALMEKVGGLIAQRIRALYAFQNFSRVGVLVGPGHNGADALVTARELWLAGYKVQVFHPFERRKELTDTHARYAQALAIPFSSSLDDLKDCDLLIDGFFGFGLERPLEGTLAQAICEVNAWPQPTVSIDLPSGLHTDTGQVLGIAIRADRTLCLGLWKLGLVQDAALEWAGTTELIDFQIPLNLIESVLGSSPLIQRLVTDRVLSQLPLSRKRVTHKYQQGHALLIGGSRKYGGSLILSGLGAQASGVGMLSIAVPASLKPLMLAQIPDAVVIDCPETPEGAIAELPPSLDLSRFDAVAYGPGATAESAAVLETVLSSSVPLILDADGLNLLAALGTERLKDRVLTILTPHAGEFRRLFPQWANLSPLQAARQAAQSCNAVIVYKGACTSITSPNAQWINVESTPALARGGSGDVLTGLMAGLLAQRNDTQEYEPITSAVWWHAQAGLWAARQHTILGVHASALAQSLLPALGEHLSSG